MKTQARSLTVSALIAAVLLPQPEYRRQTFAFWHGTSAGILPSDTKGKDRRTSAAASAIMRLPPRRRRNQPRGRLSVRRH